MVIKKKKETKPRKKRVESEEMLCDCFSKIDSNEFLYTVKLDEISKRLEEISARLDAINSNIKEDEKDHLYFYEKLEKVEKDFEQITYGLYDDGKSNEYEF